MPEHVTKSRGLPHLGLLAVLTLACGCADRPADTGMAGVSRKLNDTGITWGGNYPKGINDDCTAQDEKNGGDILSQQDCASGRDALNGHRPAFVWHKVSRTGETLPAQAQDWHCVIDNTSGLMWEVKLAADGQYGNAGLHDSDDVFTWYNSNEKQNGGNIGDWNSDGRHCHDYTAGKPKTYCHVEEFASRVNRRGLCGFNDWRLPTRAELTTIIHYGRTEPAIDAQWFPATRNDFYWSSSTVAQRPQEAWAISFRFGFTTPMRRSDTRYARLVRTHTKTDSVAASLPGERYIDHADGTVTDTHTDLMWQKCLVGQHGETCAQGGPAAFSWAEALLYPGPTNQNRSRIGGYSDWRLPNIRELATLAELQYAGPAIDPAIFPGTPPAPLWSSSPYRFYPHYAWYMDFEEGTYTYGERTDSDKHIRLVRDL